MRGCRLFCFVIVTLVCVMSMAPLRSGHGSFSAVHGPATAFRARRAFLLLLLAVATILELAASLRLMLASFIGFEVRPGGRTVRGQEFSHSGYPFRC
jgi:hypothetical protein